MEIKGIKWNYDRSELIADGVVHGVGLACALIGVTAMIFYASVWSTSGQLVAAWIYGAGLVATLSISFLYNLYPVSQTKWFLRRFDHSSIYILIAATYTPFLQRGWDDPYLFGMLIGIWSIAIVGVLIKCVFPGRFDKLAILLYLAMGLERRLCRRSASVATDRNHADPHPDRRHHLFARRDLSRLGKAALPECDLARLRRHRRRGALFRCSHLYQQCCQLSGDGGWFGCRTVLHTVSSAPSAKMRQKLNDLAPSLDSKSAPSLELLFHAGVKPGGTSS